MDSVLSGSRVTARSVTTTTTKLCQPGIHAPLSAMRCGAFFVVELHEWSTPLKKGGDHGTMM